MGQYLKALAGGLVTAALFAAAPAQAAWLEARNKHFIVYGNVSEKKMRRFADRLERFGGALRAMLGIPEPDFGTSSQVRIYLVSSETAVRKAMGRGSNNVSGFYRPALSGPIIVAPAGLSEGDEYFTADLVLFHEYTHHVLIGDVGANYPGWITEGLAELFATAQVEEDGSVTIGHAANARVDMIMVDSPMPVAQLIETDGKRLDEEQTLEKYARGWLLCHYLLLGGKRPDQLSNYIKLISAGKTPAEAGQEAFGDLKALNAELNRYRTSRLSGLRVKAERIPIDPVTVRALDAAEAAIMPLHLRSTTGETEKEAVAELPAARQIAATYPQSAFVHRVIAEVAFDAKNDAEAETEADRALAIDPRNIDAAVYKAYVAIRRASEAKPADPVLWKAARRTIAKANALDPNYALPFVMFYSSFTQTDMPPTANAFDGLMRAVALAPQSDEVRVLAFNALLQKGDLKLARHVLAPVAFDPHGSADNPARPMIALIDKGATLEEVRAAWATATAEREAKAKAGATTK